MEKNKQTNPNAPTVCSPLCPYSFSQIMQHLLLSSSVSFQGFKNAYVSKYEHIFFCSFLSCTSESNCINCCALFFFPCTKYIRSFHVSREHPHSCSQYMVFHCVDGYFVYLAHIPLMNLWVISMFLFYFIYL